MRIAFTRSLILAAALFGIGCDNEVSSTSSGSDSSAGSGGSSSSASSASSASSTSTGEGGAGGSATTSGAGGSGGVGGSTGAGGSGGAGGSASECDALAPIVLSKGAIADNDTNGKWSPGESAMVNVMMTNTSDMDIDYPGVEIISDNPDVTTGNPYNALFLIFAKQTTEIGVSYTVDPSVPAGTVVTFKATLHSINEGPCPNLPSLTFTATIQ